MIEALRHSRPKRGRRRRTAAGTSMVPEILSIINPPEEVEARLVPGHWEGDLIKGAFIRSSVGTIVGRKRRFVVLCKMDGNGAVVALDSFTPQMKRLDLSRFRSDQVLMLSGLPFKCHGALVAQQIVYVLNALSCSSNTSLDIVIVVMLLQFGSMGQITHTQKIRHSRAITNFRRGGKKWLSGLL